MCIFLLCTIPKACMYIVYSSVPIIYNLYILFPSFSRNFWVCYYWQALFRRDIKRLLTDTITVSVIVQSSVATPWHFGTDLDEDPGPRIWMRIRILGFVPLTLTNGSGWGSGILIHTTGLFYYFHVHMCRKCYEGVPCVYSLFSQLRNKQRLFLSKHL